VWRHSGGAFLIQLSVDMGRESTGGLWVEFNPVGPL